MTIGKRNTYTYYLTQLFHSMLFMLPIWIVYYLQIIDTKQIAFLVMFQYLIQLIFELPSGALADLLGRKLVNLIGLIIGAISFFLFPFAHSFLFLAVLTFFIGVCESFRSGSEEALVYDGLKQDGKESEFGKVMGNGNLFYQTGLIIAPVIGGVVYNYSHTLPYTLYGISVLFAAISSLFYLEPKIDSARFTIRNYALQIKSGIQEAFKDSFTKRMSLLYICAGAIAWSSSLFFNEFLMVELGFSNTERGFFASSLRLINALIIAKLMHNSKIFTVKRSILFFPVIMLFAYLPGVFLQGYWGLPFIQAAMIATSARFSLLSPLTNGAFSSQNRATAISVLSLLIGVVYIVLTSVSGMVISLYGVRTMYSILGIITAATVVPLAISLIKDPKS